MILRSEQPTDYNSIAELTYKAFKNWRKEDNYIHEPDMISLARQSANFDSDLSIVAEKDGEMVGHILLLPSDFMVLGRKIAGVILGPVSVLTSVQKMGIGKKLINFAHEKAKSKGFEFSLLCGHPEYYPRFGYIKNMFSFSGTKIQKPNKSDIKEIIKVDSRPLNPDDIVIIDRWQTKIRKDETLALLLEKSIMGYHAYAREKTGKVLEIDGKPVAYVKYKTYVSGKIDFIFFENNKLKPVIDYLFCETESDFLEISQPIESFEELLAGDSYIITDERKALDAFMILPLKKESNINRYCDMVAKGENNLAVICFPSYCDVG